MSESCWAGRKVEDWTACDECGRVVRRPERVFFNERGDKEVCRGCKPWETGEYRELVRRNNEFLRIWNSLQRFSRGVIDGDYGGEVDRGGTWRLSKDQADYILHHLKLHPALWRFSPVRQLWRMLRWWHYGRNAFWRHELDADFNGLKI